MSPRSLALSCPLCGLGSADGSEPAFSLARVCQHRRRCRKLAKRGSQGRVCGGRLILSHTACDTCGKARSVCIGGAAETDEPVAATVACRGCANQSNSSSQRRQGHRQTRWLQNPVLRQREELQSRLRVIQQRRGVYLPARSKHVASSVFGAGCWCPFW